MISSVLVALSAFILSSSATEIQSLNRAFYNAGIQGCVSVAANANGEPLIIHDCNTQKDLKNQDWDTTWAIRVDTAPGPIKIFGDKCIDVPNGASADGTKLQIWTCTGGPNQKFISTVDHKFKWAGSNKCIDLSGGRINDGNGLQLFECDNSDSNKNQHWTFAANPHVSGPSHFQGGNPLVQPEPIKGQPFCIGAVADTDGAAVVLLGCGVDNAGDQFPQSNYTWVAPFDPLTGQIKTYANKCLDVPGGSTENGVKLQIWTCAAGNTNQLFTAHYQQIEWAGKGKCLDLTNSNSTIGNPIQLWDCAVPDNNPNQEWTVSHG